MTAIEYGFAALLAVIMLKEIVPPARWAGIALVIIGVILIARSGGET
jgi:drug/metabolite transporter (DMT)-like permease